MFRAFILAVINDYSILPFQKVLTQIILTVAFFAGMAGILNPGNLITSIVLNLSKSEYLFISLKSPSLS
jgi:hypothetical protein